MGATPFTILIADRNPRIRDALRRLFAQEGYAVRLAGCGEDVLREACADGRQPDLVVLDLELAGGKAGVEVLGLLQERRPWLPVVLHTFLTGEVDHPAARRAAALVEKSGDAQGLLSTVAYVLRCRYKDGSQCLEEKRRRDHGPV